MSSSGKRRGGDRPRPYERILSITVLLTAIVLSAGCRRGRDVTPPETFPVSGKVTVSQGRLPAGCLIQFTPSDPKCMAEGIIESDGTFTLKTRYEGILCEGAAEGEYRVMITPPLEPHAPLAQPIQLPQPFHIKPEPNELTIRL